MRHVTLHVDLRFLAIRRGRQRNDAKHARADPLGQPLDDAALARRVPTFENDRNAGAGLLHPGLQVREFDLKPLQLLPIARAG